MSSAVQASIEAAVVRKREAKINRLRAMMEICDRSGSAAAFKAAGGTIRTGASTNTIRYAGVSASCTWSQDAGLVEAWRKAAIRQIEKIWRDA